MHLLDDGCTNQQQLHTTDGWIDWINALNWHWSFRLYIVLGGGNTAIHVIVRMSVKTNNACPEHLHQMWIRLEGLVYVPRVVPKQLLHCAMSDNIQGFLCFCEKDIWRDLIQQMPPQMSRLPCLRKKSGKHKSSSSGDYRHLCRCIWKLFREF